MYIKTLLYEIMCRKLRNVNKKLEKVANGIMFL